MKFDIPFTIIFCFIFILPPIPTPPPTISAPVIEFEDIFVFVILTTPFINELPIIVVFPTLLLIKISDVAPPILIFFTPVLNTFIELLFDNKLPLSFTYISPDTRIIPDTSKR